MESTPSQLRDFISSTIWFDISKEVKAWLDDIRDQLEDTTNIEISRRLQGNAEACRYFLNLPTTMLEDWESRDGKSD